MEILPKNIEVNVYPIDLDISQSKDQPQTNSPATPVSSSNIVPSGDGSVLRTNNLESPNFLASHSGWRLDSNGNIEANDGNFRGDITGASGTFSGSITATSGTIGGWTIGTAAIYKDGATDALSAGMAPLDYPFYAGKKYVSRSTAPFHVTTGGQVVASDIVATGTINAQSGYLSNGVYLGASDALICESSGLNVGTAGYIRGGQTTYNSGTGFFLGYSAGAYKLSIGNSSDTSKLLTWDGTDLIVNDSKISNQNIFGDGSDGDVTISGDTTLTSDMYYNNLTINNTKTLNTGGYRIFVKGTLTNNGTISNVGSNGSVGGNNDGSSNPAIGGSAGAKGPGLTVPVAGDSGAGGNSGAVPIAGTAGSNTVKSIGVAGSAGGARGGGSNGGAGGTITAAESLPRNSYQSVMLLYNYAGTVYVYAGTAGSGGGGGGIEFGGGGGGAGGAGGVITIYAKVLVNNGTITVKGGNGGNGGNAYNGGVGGTGGGGGAGGSGGVIILIYSKNTVVGTLTYTGGSLGTGGTGYIYGGGQNGANGTDGVTGKLYQLQV